MHAHALHNKKTTNWLKEKEKREKRESDSIRKIRNWAKKRKKEKKTCRGLPYIVRIVCRPVSQPSCFFTFHFPIPYYYYDYFSFCAVGRVSWAKPHTPAQHADSIPCFSFHAFVLCFPMYSVQPWSKSLQVGRARHADYLSALAPTETTNPLHTGARAFMHNKKITAYKTKMEISLRCKSRSHRGIWAKREAEGI